MPSSDSEIAALHELQGDSDFAALGRTWRGEIYEEFADNPIAADLLRCHFHRPVFRAANLVTTRLIALQGANQIAKTRIGELCLLSWLKNDPADMILYDGGDDAASADHMKTRFHPLLKSVPAICDLIQTGLDDSRHNITNQDLILPGAVIRGRVLNDTTVQRITVRYGLISDAEMTKKTGLITRAFIRSTQFEQAGLEKWFVESYGCEKTYDFVTKVMERTDEAELWITCPRCGRAQKFAFAPKRGEDFLASPTKEIPSLDHAAWIAHWSPILRSRGESSSSGRHVAGFKRGDENLIRHLDGSINEGEILRLTGYECFHCGSLLPDIPPVREALDQSVHYVPTRSGRPGWRGFKIPKWANPVVPWGSCMLAFLRALKAEKEGNLYDLMEFRTKWEGETWDEAGEIKKRQAVEFAIGTYETDPAKLMPNSHCRQCTVDCSKDQDKPHGQDESRIEWLWFDIWEWDKSGNGRQLSYGVVKGWELLAAQQRFWKVPCTRTLIDAGWMPYQVEEAALKYFELVPPDGLKDGRRVPQTPFAWRLCVGGGQNRRFTVPGKTDRSPFSIDALPGGLRAGTDKDGRAWKMLLYKLTWSNLWFEQQLSSLLAQGVDAHLERLPREKVVIIGLDGKPSPELTKFSLDRTASPPPNQPGKNRAYEDEINSRFYHEKTGKYEDYEKQSRPTEFRDTLLMQLAGIAKDGLRGHAIEEPS